MQLANKKIINKVALYLKQFQFLLYLEWDALGAALDQYQGSQSEIDKYRYQISTIAYDSDRVEIRQMVASPKEMPKLVPCKQRAVS